MTLIHYTGFDDHATVQEDGWSVPVSTLSGVTANGGRRGTGDSAMLVNQFNARINRVIPAALEHATIVQGYAFKPNADNGNAIMAFRSDAGATLHVYLHMLRTSGALQVRRGDAGGPILATSATLNKFIRPLSVWYFIELKVTLSDTVGAVELRVNGEVWASASNIDTKNGGTKTVFDTVGFADGEIEGSSTHNYHVDDYYVLNGAGSSPQDNFLGDVKVETVYPNGNGASSQWLGSDGNSTDNYLLVDEPGAPNTTDHVASSVVGERDLYTIGNLISTSGTIYGVTPRIYAITSDAGTRGAKGVVKSGATVVLGAEKTLNTTPTMWGDVYETDPDTSSPWSVAGVNGVEAGVEVST